MTQNSDFDLNRFLCDLPWVTSITPPSRDWDTTIPVHHDLLFIKSTNNDLNTFAKEIKLDTSSTYIFSDSNSFVTRGSGRTGSETRVLITFVAPTSCKSLTLRVKHFGTKDIPLEVTLGSSKIQLNLSLKSSLTIDDITLHPIRVSCSSESDHLSFVPEVRNVIFIEFRTIEWYFAQHCLHDIELLDEDGLEYMPHSASLSNTV